MNVLTKQQNYRLWRSGAFGNKLRSWRYVDWQPSLFNGSVALRALLRNGGGPCCYDLAPEHVGVYAQVWNEQGIPFECMMVNEMAPSDILLLQGEYLNDIHSFGSCWGYFLHSRIQKPMRIALERHPEIAQGLRADLLIREAMTPSTHDDWQMLLEQYPGHVFEVSIFDRCLGDTPNRNALVWEVRKY